MWSPCNISKVGLKYKESYNQQIKLLLLYRVFECHSINSVCLFVVYVSSFNVFESISLYNYGSVCARFQPLALKNVFLNAKDGGAKLLIFKCS